MARNKQSRSPGTTGIRYVIGIDEVGRGPLAGPVTVCACLVPVALYRNSYRQLEKALRKNHGIGLVDIRDSKKLSEAKRDRLRAIFDSGASSIGIRFALHSFSAKEIDKRGIAAAIRAAIAKTISSLRNVARFDASAVLVLLDGSLKAPIEYANQRTIIKGDDIEKAISCASIVAKTHRDAYMKRLDAKLSGMGSGETGYEFARHKGYGTKRHYELIRKHGISEHHRRTFLRSMS